MLFHVESPCLTLKIKLAVQLFSQIDRFSDLLWDHSSMSVIHDQLLLFAVKSNFPTFIQ